MVVIYAEKPDMGEKIAAALGCGSFTADQKKQGYYQIMFEGQEYFVTWGYGHLCALSEAAQYNSTYKSWRNIPLPFIPDTFQIVLNTKSKFPVAQTYQIVKRLFDQAEYIINATDFDREGELIFYYLYSYSGCRKPVMRVNLASTTVQGIKDAFHGLMSSQDFANLLEAARCRSIADWVIGCNLTVAMTLKQGDGKVYPIGRVQTPTLAMVVNRDEEIKNFKPEDYFTVEGVFADKNNLEYKGLHIKKKFQSMEEAKKICDQCVSEQEGIITDIVTEDVIKMPPYLYNMDTLQMQANELYGFTLDRTMDLTQHLYEKGYVTYPRTDCQYLPEDMFSKMQHIQEMLRLHICGNLFNQNASVDNMRRNKKRFFDNSKLGSHFAIIPTESVPQGLTPDEKKIYGLIADSVIRMLYPAAHIQKTQLTTSVNQEAFVSYGSAICEEGWLYVNGVMREEFLPLLTKGERVMVRSINMQSKKTKPPKAFTDKSLLAAMKSAGRDLEDDELRKLMIEKKINGIGTVATRGSIVKSLITRGFLVREKNKIHASQTGINLIHAIPIKEIKSAVLTAEWEKRLHDIQEGTENPYVFLQDLYRCIKEWCVKFQSMQTPAIAPSSQGKVEQSGLNLMCPTCGAPLRKLNWGYGCSNYSNGCKFSIGKIAGKLLTEKQVKLLLSKGKLGPLSGFKRKDGNEFEATLVLILEKEGEEIRNYKIGFARKESLKDKMPDIYARCPDCGSRIIRGNFGWICESKCGTEVPYIISQRNTETEIAECLFRNGYTNILYGFVSKKGKPFAAGLKLEDKKVKFYFPEY